MPPAAAVLIMVLLLWLSTPLAAQRVEYGGFVGYSLVGGGDSRTIVGTGTGTVTGADQAGLHLRGFVDLPLQASGLSLRAELFYNRLTSGPTAYAQVGNESAKVALVDRTMGLTGSFVATTSRTAAVAPYFSLGAGLFTSQLGHNPSDGDTRVAASTSGMGLGLVAGGGVRFRVGGPTLLLDWRYYQALNRTRGVGFIPLSVGVAF